MDLTSITQHWERFDGMCSAPTWFIRHYTKVTAREDHGIRFVLMLHNLEYEFLEAETALAAIKLLINDTDSGYSLRVFLDTHAQTVRP